MVFGVKLNTFRLQKKGTKTELNCCAMPANPKANIASFELVFLLPVQACT